mgnify:CR=1 FL=1
MLRVFLLGRFRVRRGDEPLDTGRRAPRRPLQLLQAIAVLGPREAGLSHVVGALWPDAEGDAGMAACEIALHRLRRLIGDASGVWLRQGLIGLAPDRVWLDTEAFERLADDVAQRQDLDALAPALALYGGPLLAHEEDRPWLLAARPRLRSRYVRLAGAGARMLEAAGRGSEAVEILQRALEHEPLAEPLHRALIAAHVRAGRAAEATEAYRSCALLLREVLGVTPAPDTQRALVQSCRPARGSS